MTINLHLIMVCPIYHMFDHISTLIRNNFHYFFYLVSSDTNEEPLDLSIKKIDIQKETEIRNWILSITDEQINNFDPLIMRAGSPTPSVKCASSIFADLITNLRFQNSNV